MTLVWQRAFSQRLLLSALHLLALLMLQSP
jgi:hypothetical protein